VVLIVQELGFVFDGYEFTNAPRKKTCQTRCSVTRFSPLWSLCSDLIETRRGEAAIRRFQVERGYRPITCDTRFDPAIRIGNHTYSLRWPLSWRQAVSQRIAQRTTLGRSEAFCFPPQMPIIPSMSKHQTRPITLEQLVAPHSEVDALTGKCQFSPADQMLLAALARCCSAETSPLVARQPAADAESFRLTLVAALSARDDDLMKRVIASVAKIQPREDGKRTQYEEIRSHFRSVAHSCESLGQLLRWTVVFSLGAMLFSAVLFVVVGAGQLPGGDHWSNGEVGISVTLVASGRLRLVANNQVYWLEPEGDVSVWEKQRQPSEDVR